MLGALDCANGAAGIVAGGKATKCYPIPIFFDPAKSREDRALPSVPLCEVDRESAQSATIATNTAEKRGGGSQQSQILKSDLQNF